MTDDEKKDLIEKINETYAKQQSQPDQYVVVYKKISDDEVIGYHASTFCELTDDMLKAKRYHGKKEFKQLGIINDNLKSFLSLDQSEKENIFTKMKVKIKEKYYKDIEHKDIYLEAIYLDEDIDPIKKTLKFID